MAVLLIKDIGAYFSRCFNTRLYYWSRRHKLTSNDVFVYGCIIDQGDRSLLHLMFLYTTVLLVE